jgi:hypothetical protein
MKYLKKSFSFSMAEADITQEDWDRIFAPPSYDDWDTLWEQAAREAEDCFDDDEHECDCSICERVRGWLGES